MHNYGLSNNIRAQVNFYIVIASVISSYILNEFVQYIIGSWDIPCLTVVVSLALVYKIYSWLWNNHIWKYKIVSKITNIPNFTGVWKGNGISSYEENGSRKEYSINIEINQNFNDISIHLRANDSESESTFAYVRNEDILHKVLYYGYKNKRHDLKDMQFHDGTTTLKIISENKIEGFYYTSREPQTKGYFNLKKIY
ncbi:hypothetical protein [Methanococcus voltae]|uniref:Uncharacterized protein n=1 Tax=Methanococcus voltae (strain ATCC BAA-1334 / A3) TaxID=456320 RepID=D7DSL8_METV3|nr:hypothetical protein [Methanococcus voltae]MCS3901727.1 hypothetical protein [Methanococcus voltae]